MPSLIKVLTVINDVASFKDFQRCHLFKASYTVGQAIITNMYIAAETLLQR